MNRCLVIAIVSLLSLSLSCRWDRPAEELRDTGPGLLVTVPSDAVAVACFNTFSEVPEFLSDKSDILRKPDLSILKDSRAILSYCYTGSSTPILTIDLGESSAEKTFSYDDILKGCNEAGLKGAILRKCWQGNTRDAICLSPSRTLISEVERHLAAGSSILDAPLFDKALLSAGNAGKVVFLRNSRAGLIVPKDFLEGMIPRKQSVEFIRKVSDWTILRAADNCYEISTIQGESDAYYANMISRLPFAGCRIAEMLPDSTEFAISIAIPEKSFRENYERYLDANIKLTAYRKTLAGLKKKSGKNPLIWEEENGVEEVALVRWNGRNVILVRSRDKVSGNGISENHFRSFIPALYGQFFSIADDSFKSAGGEWTVYGSREDIDEFSRSGRLDGEFLPGKGCKFVIYSPDGLTYMDKKACIYGISIGKQAS